MPVLTGVLLDVSEVDEEYGCGLWAQSIPEVLNDLIKKDAVQSNHVFALGVGASRWHTEVFDLLNTLKYYLNQGIESRWSVNDESVMAVQEACDILCAVERHSHMIDELFTIYDIHAKPLKDAFVQAQRLFALPEYDDHQKVLYVLSDGNVRETIEPQDIFFGQDVKVVSCLLSDNSLSQPLKLYSKVVQGWREPTKFMFRLSSAVKTALIPHSIYSKRGWKIDETNDKTKLFFLVNHPNVIPGMCDIVRDVVSAEDALSEFEDSDLVCLKEFISPTTGSFVPKEQEGGTCYAYACALVLHLVMKRIVMRDGGYPTFSEICQKLIYENGMDGAKIHKVLREVCPEYRLHFQEVNAVGARKAIASNRPVIARFSLTKEEWQTFSNFYRGNKKGILTKSQIDISKRSPWARLEGHAVVLTSSDCESLRFINSWGTGWGDGGFFRVDEADVLGFQFTDVFWTLDDLVKKERDEYIRRGLDVVKRLRVETRIQVLGTKYLCPVCLGKPQLNDFTDCYLEVYCSDHGTFKKFW